jgi:Fe2+ transport system protein FeoA
MSDHLYLPLDQLESGERGVVRQLAGGKGFASRLASMRLAVGAHIELLDNRGRGTLLILVRDTRVALGCRSEAQCIVAEKLPHERVEG